MKKKRIRILVNIVKAGPDKAPSSWSFNVKLTKHPFIITILA